MNAIRPVLALVVLLPFAAVAATDAVGSGESVLPEVATVSAGAPQLPGTDCCWVWMYGRWICMPC